MPTYIYKCPKCDFILEQLLTMGEYIAQSKPKCCQPGCDGQQEMRPQLSAPAFILKGTGWTPNFSNGEADGVSTDIIHGKKR